MNFCDHCDGQRFDRAQVLRALRATRKRLRTPGKADKTDHAFAAAIAAVRGLDIPHLDLVDELADGDVVH